ncbi:MAG: ABC transporter substrate-binding protein [Ilumatobacter sp.]|uniref:ABC transporter substrate-binding protein n=1 Tax=Ilumatobacter sp. TaxID=1967498 RepID=UPI0026386642|nr:ABC transporter substrate-binding protein [Ilumatobacter sp.]MDJ0768684.1 ABC transporter substrate-binding protein [Ilumatobacter sp.]
MPTPRAKLRRSGRSWAAVVLAASIATSCTGGSDEVAPTTTVVVTTTTLPERTGDGVLSIGVFLPRTGPGASLGEPMIEAIEDAVQLINDAGGALGNDVELTTIDEESDTGPDELLAAGVDAVIGPASSLVALSRLDALVRLDTGVVTCSPSATALSLDDYPDNSYFFRTVPSDSLQMAAIASRIEQTGVDTVAIAYLDDPYGRGLEAALVSELQARDAVSIVEQVGFSGDEENLSDAANTLLTGTPGAVVVLGDADDGSRLLAALDDAPRRTPSAIIVNDAIREARQTIQNLSPSFRVRLTAVAPLATSVIDDGPTGFFAAHAVDCVNLVSLAAIQAGSDAPNRVRANMASVSTGGRVCSDYARCVELLEDEDGLRIDYNGLSGSVDLSNTTGDPVRATFEAIAFDAQGADDPAATRRFDVP